MKSFGSLKSFKAVSLALFGTFIEYYDYALYGFAAPILAIHFFPKNDPAVVLLQAYGIFFAGSCSKPLGSLLFGFLGDRFGRAFALKLSIFGIAIPTVIIGILPGYRTWGWLAPFLLFVCRILQGIFVSGESDSARVFIFESLPKKYRCLSNSLAYCLCMLGIYWASFSLNTLFAENSVNSTNDVSAQISQNSNLGDFLSAQLGMEIIIEYWRIPFLIAGILGLFLFILRQDMQETQPFLRQLKTRDTKAKFNFFSTFNISDKSAVLITLLMTGAAGGQYHFYFVFLPSYLGKILTPLNPSSSIDPLNQLLTNVNITAAQYSYSLLVFALCLPVAGLLADKLSHRFKLISLLKGSALLIFGLAIINTLYILQGSLPYTLILLTAIALSFAQANTFVVILNQFNVTERCRGTSLGHALGSMLLSGSTPFISLWLWNFTEIQSAPFIYFLILCSISYVALLLLEGKQKKRSIKDEFFNPFVIENATK